MDKANIEKAIARRTEIKEQISELQEEDGRIVDWLNKELAVDLTSTASQKFETDNWFITAKPVVNQRITDQTKLEKVIGENGFDDCFSFKIATTANFNKLDNVQKALFADCVTESNGKTQYTFKAKTEETV